MTAATLSPERPPVGLRVRRFNSEDYPAVLAVHNLCYPEYADTVEEWQFQDNNRSPKIRWNRFVAEDNEGAILGFGQYHQHEDMYHPQKFNIKIYVHPEHQGRGIGSAVYDTLLEALTPYDPLVVRANIREDHTRAVKFATDRGFTDGMRDWESRLDPRALDFSQWADARPKVAAQGIVIKSVAELASDPDRDRKLYEMDWTITLDMPSSDTLTKPDFEHFMSRVMGGPNLIPDAWFVALDGDTYVGESSLWRSKTDDSLFVGATGVLREYRRRGIATALKIQALEYAAAIGCPQVKTWNAQSNRPMLSINEALGFEKQPAWIEYTLAIKEESE